MQRLPEGRVMACVHTFVCVEAQKSLTLNTRGARMSRGPALPGSVQRMDINYLGTVVIMAVYEVAEFFDVIFASSL